MTAEQFTYWLQGYFEINDPDRISPIETKIIKDHLALVFKKETPNRTVVVPNKTEIVTNPFEKGYPSVNPYTVTCTGPDPISTATGRVIC